MSWLKPVAFCVCSVQQNGQIPCNQPLPLHGSDIYHLSAKGGLWFQGQHRAAGEQIRAKEMQSMKVNKTNDVQFYIVLLNQYDIVRREMFVSWWC